MIPPYKNPGFIVSSSIVALLLVFQITDKAPLSAQVGTLDESLKEMQIFVEAYRVIQSEYADTTKVSPKSLIEAAINGMLETLDPHSRFLPEQEAKQLMIETEGEFGGIGIHIGKEDGKLTVIAPVEGTPAWKGGIEGGDIIISIDGVSTETMTLDFAVTRLRGPVGKPVTLGIKRENFPDTLTIKLIRDIIQVHSVRHTMHDNIGYIRMSQFTERTSEELDKAITALSRDRARGLILDLRDNPGGVLTGAIAVTNRFIDTGAIVSIVARDPSQTMTYYASGVSVSSDLPLVVLVNGNSASASEIVAGAVQDHRRGVVIGTKTYGKGSVQTVEPLPENTKLALTTARYATPSGRLIHGIGIEPDTGMNIEIPKLSDTEIKAIQALRDSEIVRDFANKKTAYTSEDIDRLAKIVKDAGIEISRATLERYFAAELARRNESKIYLLPHLDPQLKKAIDILKAALRLDPSLATR